MASLKQCKVHNQSGSFRVRLPLSWVRENHVKTKDELDVIESHALVVLPERDLSQTEVDEMIADIKQLMPVRRMLRSAKRR